MNQTFLKALQITLISLGIAFAFNFLFFMKEPGVSVPIFVGLLLGVLLLFGRYWGLNLGKTWWLILAILFFALMTGIRANEFLIVLDIFAALGLLFLLAHELNGTPAFLMKIKDYFMIIFLPFRMLGSAFLTLSYIGRIHSSVKDRDVLSRIAKGVIMALPVLVIFVILLSQADLVFSKFINSFIDINISERTIQYIALLSFSFVSSLCFFSYIFFPGQRAINDNTEPDVNNGRGIEVMVSLVLIAILFLIFIGFQVTYLFGGDTNIINAGFTYAEYARRGFWELLAVGALSLLLLLASEKYARSESKKKEFIVPALVLIAEIMIIIFSAFKRLSLYVEAYSLTELRFYAAGFVLLLLALFLLLAYKFVRRKPEQFFTSGTLLTVIVFLATINIINPDSFIAGANMELYDRTGKIDADYMGRLSSDAAAEKIELYKKLEGEDKNILREWLIKERERIERNADWRSYKVSRAKALQMYNELGI